MHVQYPICYSDSLPLTHPITPPHLMEDCEDADGESTDTDGAELDTSSEGSVSGGDSGMEVDAVAPLSQHRPLHPPLQPLRKNNPNQKKTCSWLRHRSSSQSSKQLPITKVANHPGSQFSRLHHQERWTGSGSGPMGCCSPPLWTTRPPVECILSPPTPPTTPTHST